MASSAKDAADADPRHATVLYKILLPSEAETLPERDWAGTQLDVRLCPTRTCCKCRMARLLTTFSPALQQHDGFLHFSSKHQLRGTLTRFFGHVDQVTICALPIAQLHVQSEGVGRLQYDESHGQLFAHIYGVSALPVPPRPTARQYAFLWRHASKESCSLNLLLFVVLRLAPLHPIHRTTQTIHPKSHFVWRRNMHAAGGDWNNLDVTQLDF